MLDLLYETLSEQTDPMLFESPELDQQFQKMEQFFSGDKKRQIRASDTLCSLVAGYQKKAFAVGFRAADECYIDYPTIIKNAGLNGFTKSATTTPEDTKKDTSDNDTLKQILQHVFSIDKKLQNSTTNQIDKL